jgi:hypothetical protein
VKKYGKIVREKERKKSTGKIKYGKKYEKKKYEKKKYGGKSTGKIVRENTGEKVT